MIGFIEIPQGIHKGHRAEMLLLRRLLTEQYKVVLLLIRKVQGDQKASYQTPDTNSLFTQTGTKKKKSKCTVFLNYSYF